MQKLLFVLVLSTVVTAKAQIKFWTLQDCIDTALNKNIDFTIAQRNTQLAREDLEAAKASKLPDLNFGGGQFIQTGRSIDRFTNQFVVQTIASNNFQLSSNAVLYAGGQLRQQTNAATLNTKASEEDLRFTRQNLSFNVANAYLQAVQAGEQKVISQQNLNTTGKQLARIEKLYNAGAASEGDLISLEAQKANEEAIFVNSQTAENAALTNLKLILRLPGNYKFALKSLNLGTVKTSNYPLDLEELYDTAVALRPDIKAAALRLAATEAIQKSTEGSRLPTITAGANLNTVYSGNAQEVTGFTVNGAQTIGVVKNTGDIVEAPSILYNTNTIGFGEQIQNNFGGSLGINLSMPIYNKRQIKTSINKAKINTEISKLSLERNKQALYNEIATAYINFTNSYSRYNANNFAFELQKKNVELNQKRFEAGQISEFDFQITKNGFNMANQNYIVAKYNYVFNRLVLDYYAGLELSL